MGRSLSLGVGGRVSIAFVDSDLVGSLPAGRGRPSPPQARSSKLVRLCRSRLSFLRRFRDLPVLQAYSFAVLGQALDTTI